jgi:hypothetical protein
MGMRKARNSVVAILAAAVFAVLAMPVAADENDAAQGFAFPAWVYEQPLPAWLFTVDEFPDWFFDLEEEPVWFRQIDRIPAWFFTITEIPDWFFPDRAVAVAPTPTPAEPDDPTTPAETVLDPSVPDSEPLEYLHRQGVIMYEHYLGGGEVLISSVPNGMITDSEVFLFFPIEYFMLMRGGEFVAAELGMTVTENGHYTLIELDEDYGVWDVLNIVFSFTIAAQPVNDLVHYTVPVGFSFAEVLHNGMAQHIPNPHIFELGDDGEYQFTIVSENYETMYTVSIVLDTTPPAIVFGRTVNGEHTPLALTVDGNYSLYAPIIFEVTDLTEYTIQVARNREIIFAHNNTLTQPGRYQVLVVDAAGNFSLYTFRIAYVMDVPTVWIIVITVGLFAALVIYLVRNRKKIRVR